MTENLGAYRRATLTTLIIFVGSVFLLALLPGTMLSGFLNYLLIGGFPLGSWLAEQGVVYLIVGLYVAYCVITGRIEDRHQVHE